MKGPMLLIFLISMIVLCSSLSSSLSSIRKTFSLALLPILFISNNNNVNAKDLDNGSKLFTQSCNTCHSGGGNNVPFSGGKTLSLVDLTKNDYNNIDNIVNIINKGKGLMPGYGSFKGSKGQIVPSKFSDNDIKDMAEFILDKANNNWN